MAVSEF